MSEISIVGLQDYSIFNTRSFVVMKINNQLKIENNLLDEDNGVLGKKMHQIPVYKTFFCEKENLFLSCMQNSIVIYSWPNLQEKKTFDIHISEGEPIFSVSENGQFYFFIFYFIFKFIFIFRSFFGLYCT